MGKSIFSLTTYNSPSIYKLMISRDKFFQISKRNYSFEYNRYTT